MGTPVRGRGALEGHVQAVAQCVCCGFKGVGVLVHGDGFAGQSRFVHLELRGVDEAQVGWNLVARLQQHDVARHQHMRWHLLYLPGTQHRGLRFREALQGGQCLIGAPRLHQPNGGVEQHDHHNHQRVHQVAHHTGDDGSSQ